ncbi:tannase and feruloyl esterase [Penicillium macrosclerotiorum]|uniref:tannase and feruloyl esterase n=1 Tax=Penicillium macrosclerotiorum TaxID=303699 RepID=UPI002547347D|nr:tannase and feruloyl esterase [Penicillium macrosclerotiorum]KAJ5679799.1 tannase and feruloyl esterase [Penicillium macrosclerotiorum]
MIFLKVATVANLVFGTATAVKTSNRASCKVSTFQKFIDADSTIATVQWATYIPQNGSFNPENYTSATEYPTKLPESCAVQINVASEGNSSYLVGIILPYDWNGRMLSAAAGGGINWVDMGTGTHYGFATVSSNLGHVGIDTTGTWALGRPEAVIDWGYRAWHGTTVLGKLLIKNYMKNLQMYPEDYDGVIAGAPAWWTTHQQLWNLKQTTYQAPVNSSHTIPGVMFDILAAEVIKQCDPQDGLLDNIISDPQGCNFDPSTLACNATSLSDECLTADQLSTLYKLYNDWVDVNQTFVYGHVWLGSEASWLLGNIGLGENSTIEQQYWYPQDLMGLGQSFVWQGLDYNTVQLAEKLNPGNATADQYDISEFYNRGGKFLHYHGLSDAYVSPDSSIYYYDHAKSAVQPQGIKMDEFYRMFLIPGMEHCDSTPDNMNAPWYVAGLNQAATINTGTYSTPGYRDARHDVVLALMAWVENGTAPAEIVATKWKNDTTATEVLRQRPICHYPNQARYDGNGDPDSASSWTCESLY